MILGHVNDPLMFSRWKRDVFSPIFRVRDKYVAEPTNIERRGGFHFVGKTKITSIWLKPI